MKRPAATISTSLKIDTKSQTERKTEQTRAQVLGKDIPLETYSNSNDRIIHMSPCDYLNH